MNKLAIHSVPRSGSSWLGSIFNSSPLVQYRFQPLFSYAFKGYLHNQSTKEEIDEFFKEILQSEDSFLNQEKNKTEKNHPRFRKIKNVSLIAYKEVRYHYILENLLKTNDGVKVIGLIRNPLAVINSWINAPKEFKPEWDELSEWRYANLKNKGREEEYYGFEKWKEVTNLFLRLEKEFPSRFKLLKYQDLLDDTISIVQDLFEFMAVPFEKQTLNFIKESKTTEVLNEYAVYKKKDNDYTWQNELNPGIISKIKEDIINTPLSIFIE